MIKNIESLKAQIDIIDIVGNHIELKKAGVNFKACCPFHGEQTPSFVVSPAKQICHCFGCGNTYDAIGFVQELKKLTFIEAVEDIANDMNFILEHDANSNQKDYSKLMEHTNRFYQDHLNKEITDYLLSRGLTQESITAFEVGYAPQSSEQVQSIAQELFSTSDATECGILAADDSGKIYARLTKRVTFPIRNHTNKLIGFGGRVLAGDERAKYINSPQTKLFDKSRNFYGFNLAKEHIYKKGIFTITEGYLDVIMFHQAGIKTAVATMGTALTEQHCHLIKKAQARVLLCFDGDKAGKEAAFKASKLLSTHDIYGGVVIFPTGKDPADMVKEGEREELFALMKKTTPLIKFAITHIAANFNLAVPNQKQEALKEITEFLQTLSPLIQDEYKPYVAQVLNINQNHIVLKQNDMPVQSYPPMQRANLFNIAEMSIIKTAAEDENKLNLVLDYIDTTMFDWHQKEFEMLKANDAALQGLLLADGLKTYETNDLVRQLKVMLITHHTKEIQTIMQSQENFERKSFEIKKTKGIIFNLKKELLKETA